MIKIAIIDDGINSYEYNILNVQENIKLDREKTRAIEEEKAKAQNLVETDKGGNDNE